VTAVDFYFYGPWRIAAHATLIEIETERERERGRVRERSCGRVREIEKDYVVQPWERL